MDLPDGGGAGDTGTRIERIGNRRSLLTRSDPRTDAVLMPVAVRGLVSAAGIAVQGLVRFVYSLLVGRTLPVGFLSATNSAISTAMFASLLWPTSLGAAATKFVAREAGNIPLRIALTRYLARLSLLTSTVLGVVAGLLTYFVLSPSQLVTAISVALLTVGLAGYTFVRGVQYATNRVLRATVWDVLSFIVAVGGLVLVLVFDLHSLLLLPITAGYALYAVAGWPRSSAGRVDPVLRSEINRFVAWGVLGSLATGGFLQLTMVLAHQTGDVVSADAYAAALTLATPTSMVGGVLSLLLLPSLSGAVGRGDLDAVRRNTDVAQRGLIAVVGGVFGVLVVGSRLVVALIWPELSAAVPVLEILLVATFLLTVSTVSSESIRSYNEHGARVVALIRTSGFLVGLGVAAALIPTLSVTGIAIGYLAGMVITGCLPPALVWRRDGHRWTGLMLRVLVGAVLAAVLVWLRHRTTGSGWVDVAMVVAFAIGWMLLHRADLLAVARRSLGSRLGGAAQ
jgi:O-antigen/teichoic acid export membrane protein